MTIKKTILALCIFLFLQSVVSAQTEEPQNEIGINVTSLIVNILGSGSASNNTDFNDVVYRRIKGNKALRIGLGIRALINADQVTDIPGTRNLSDVNVSLSIGKEWRKNVAKKWLYYGGLVTYLNGGVSKSVTFLQDDTNSFIGSVAATTREIGVGAGPILGFQYNLNDHFSLGTQGAFNIFFSFRHRDIESFLVPEEKTNSFSFTATTQLPSLLFFNLKF